MLSCVCTSYVDEDVDLHESLRTYARLHLGAPEDPWAKHVKVRDITDFGGTFRSVLERNGWPVLKCGNGKGLKRCLMLEKNVLTWGSRKANGATCVPLSDIKSVQQVPFKDGPEGANPKAMIVFNINDTHGLKFLCETEADASAIVYGFKLIKPFY